MALPVTITGLATSNTWAGPFRADVPTALYTITTANTLSVAFGQATLNSRQISQSFTTSAGGGSVGSVVVNLSKTGVPADSVVADIFLTDGASTPIGSSLGQANGIAAASLTTAQVSYTLTFSTPVVLSASTQYAVILSRTGGVSDSAYFNAGYANSSVDAAQKYATLNDTGSWVLQGTGKDISLTVNGTGTTPTYYLFGGDATTATLLQCYKSTAPDTSWASIATKSCAQAIGWISAYQVGTTLHVLVSSTSTGSTTNVQYNQFNTLTDSFSLAAMETVVGPVASAGGVGNNVTKCALVVRASGEPVAFYNGVNTTTTASRARNYYSRRTGVNTWSAQVQVDANTNVDNLVCDAVLGAADRVHFFRRNNTGATMWTRDLSSTNVLGTERAFTSTNAGYGQAVAYDVSGTTKVVYSWPGPSLTLKVGKYDSGASPTVTEVAVNASLTDTPIRTFVDGQTVYTMWRGSSDNDLYVKSSTDHGATWSAQTSIYVGTVGTSELNVSFDGKPYIRGGNWVIPYIYNDTGAGVIQYNEYILRAATTSYTMPAVTGAFALAGIAATPRIGMPVVKGAFALSGKVANLLRSTGTWDTDPAYIPNSNTTFSNGNRTATITSNAFGTNLWSVTSYLSTSAALVYFEVKIDTGPSTGSVGVWSHDFSEFASVTESGNLFSNSITIGTFSHLVYGAGDVVQMAVRFGSPNMFWARVNGGFWNSGATDDPVTNVGGLAQVNTSPVCINRSTTAGGGSVTTINTGTVAFTGALPSGFSPWFGKTPKVLTAVKGAFTLTGNAATLTYATPHYTMPAVVGTFALTGVAATLTKTTAGGTTNPVQKNGGTSSASANIVTSLPSATTAGNTILIFVTSGATVTTPSGFTSRSPQVFSAGGYLFEKLVASGNSTDTPTLVMPGAYDAVWQIAEYKNITAYDTSAGDASNSQAGGVPYSTPVIFPVGGNNTRLVAFSNGMNTGGFFAAGDPSGWTNLFTGQQSNQIFGPGSAGREPLAGGWADLLVTASGAGYSTASTTGVATHNYNAETIIAAYTTTDVPPPSPGPHFRSMSTASYGNRTNTVLTAPAGITNGDILILGLAIGAGTPPTPTLPSGFTQIDVRTATQSGGGFSVDQRIAWKRASSESGSYTITHANASSNAFIAVYSNCIATGSPIDAYSKNGADSGGSLGTALSVTTTSANTMVLLIDHDWAAGGGQLPQSAAFVERYENLEWLADAVFPTAGATGNISVGPLTMPYSAWQIALKPAATGATAYTLTATTGAFTLAGTTTGLKTARKLPAVAGAVTLAGIATGLKFGHKLPAVVGAFTLGGVAAATRAARMLPAVTGAFTLNGVAAALRYGRILTAVTGPFTLNGQIASLVYSSKKTLTAVTGTFALNGPATILKYARLFPTVTGTFALNGVANILRYGHRMVVTVGAFTLNGVAASLRTARILPAVKGSVTLNGVAATLNYKRIMTATTGSFVLNGSPANLINSSNPSKVLPAVVGAFTLTGIAPVLRRKAILPAIKGSFTLAGTTTGLTAARRLVAVTGTFALSGKVTGLRVAHNLSTTTGVFTLNGNTASLRYGEGFHAVTGAFTLTGYPAVLSRSLSIQPSLFTNTNVFYTPVVAIFQPLFPELFVNQNRFFTHSISYKQFITPGLYSDPDRFFSPAVNLFYGDTEVVFAPYENRRMEAAFERRSMIAPREDRLMYAMALEGTVDSPALAARENKFMEVLDEENDMFAGPRERA